MQVHQGLFLQNTQDYFVSHRYLFGMVQDYQLLARAYISHNSVLFYI